MATHIMARESRRYRCVKDGPGPQATTNDALLQSHPRPPPPVHEGWSFLDVQGIVSIPNHCLPNTRP